MTRLFKYLPSRFLDETLSDGRFLCHNLTYFIHSEDHARGDVWEGAHRDQPEGGFIVKNRRTGKSIRGRFAFINSVVPEAVYIFCLSRRFDKAMFSELGYDACIEITDTTTFLERFRRGVLKGMTTKKVFYEVGDVEYFDPTAAARQAVSDVKALPFFKHIQFANQAETRIAFGRTDRVMLKKKQIVHADFFDRLSDVAGGRVDEKYVSVGRLADIAIPHVV